MNPVERIYAALPALLYVNASLVGPLLRPLLDAQDNLTTPYAAPDIGRSYVRESRFGEVDEVAMECLESAECVRMPKRHCGSRVGRDTRSTTNVGCSLLP